MDFAAQLGWQQGYWHSQRGTPPTFPAGGVTLSQIFQGTILARFFPSPQDLLRFVIPINGFGAQGQEPDIDPDDVIRTDIWARGPWWDWSWWASAGITTARALGNWVARTSKAIIRNEMKFVRCFEANRFSAEVIRLTAGTRFHTIATYVAPATEILPALSVYSDVPAIAIKASRSGAGGTEIVYASGINAGLKRLAGRAVLRSVGDKLTPAMAVTFAFTTGYNISIAAGCRISNPRL